MDQPQPDVLSQKAFVGRFWKSARGFWRADTRVIAWSLTIGLLVVILTQTAFQYRMNVWSRDFFNAMEEKNGQEVFSQIITFFPLLLTLVALAVCAVYGRMTIQRRWREWLTKQLIIKWFANGRYYQLDLVTGDHQNPEGRIAEDARLATDAPVDFCTGIATSVVTALAFIGVLWFVGGSLTVTTPLGPVTIPGFLTFAAIIYAAITTAVVILVSRRFIHVSERTSQAEAEFRYALTRVRENSESIALLGGEKQESAGLDQSLTMVIRQWLSLCYQHMRYTVVSNFHFLIAPIVPVLLCSPKFVAAEMSLGEVMQAAAAFVHVQSAFNWLLENFPRLAGWAASARRVGSLLNSIDHLDAATLPDSMRAISRTTEDGASLHIENLSVELDDGTVVIDDADVLIQPGEKILLLGESGTGKTTLTRAIAGLWPWGQGNVAIPNGTKILMMPQRPYIPLGSLRRAATYPLSKDEIPDADLHELMNAVGLDYLVGRLDEEAPWHRTLSGGECQRLAFVRLMLHRPDIVVLDEATSALDLKSQETLMKIVMERLPKTTVISIAHRPELEAFHYRKLIFERRPGGAQLMTDEKLGGQPISKFFAKAADALRHALTRRQ